MSGLDFIVLDDGVAAVAVLLLPSCNCCDCRTFRFGGLDCDFDCDRDG